MLNKKYPTSRTSSSIDEEKRRKILPKEEIELVERLRAQAEEAQNRFDDAERTAFLLNEMIGDGNDLLSSVNETYEGHSFLTLRYQLLRILIIDIYALIFDHDTRTGSILSIINDFEKCNCAIRAIKNYYSNPNCLRVTVTGDELDEVAKLKFIEEDKARHFKSRKAVIEALWKRIKEKSGLLKSDNAENLKWARNKIVAHCERKSDGLLTFDEKPPCGEKPITWQDPIEFLLEIKPFVYDVYLLIMSTEWDQGFTKRNKFYAQVFWDRFKNGETNLQPDWQ